MKKPNTATWVTVITVGAAVGFWSSKLLVKKEDGKGKSSAAQQLEGMSYWTCPMHPQIHSDRPGECPICHMKLVQVRAQGSHVAHEEREARGMVSASTAEMQLLGVQKVAVEKMDLTAHIPIAGRLLSASTVAFQVYESDLRYVKPGLAFHGTSSFHPETEIQGTISSVDSIVDPTSRTVRVVGQIKRGPGGLISETTFSGEIDVTLKAVTAIPESAVLHTGIEDLAYVIHDDGKMMAHPVQLGQKTESYYEVVAGLTPGEFISSGPNFLIDSEAKIRAASMPKEGEAEGAGTPSCPSGELWDIPMAMCMPGKAK
jgi:hypothetical protein